MGGSPPGGGELRERRGGELLERPTRLLGNYLNADTFEDTWAERAPLGWDVHNSEVVARGCIALFSDLLPMTTGEILHVDGGVHAVQ